MAWLHVNLADVAMVTSGVPFRERVANEADGGIAVIHARDLSDTRWVNVSSTSKVSALPGGAEASLRAGDGARIEWGDTLNDPKLVDAGGLAKFDVVLANPPFSLDKWGAENAERDRYGRFFRGVPPKSKGDWAFITRMIESAKKRERRVAVVVPHGVLFRGGKEGLIRKAVIEENLLDAVIGLPANLFQTTSIPVAVLLFDRRREKGGALEERRDVFFIDASREFQPGKNQNNLLDSHVARIVETLRERKDVERYSRAAPVAEVAENDFNLNIPRYVDTFEAAEEVDIVAVQKEIDALEAELAGLRVTMRNHLKELGLNV